MGFPNLDARRRTPQDTIRLLQQELADTNREVLALTLELDKRVDELRAAEQRYRRLAENAPDVIFRYELQPRPACTFANPRISGLTGFTPEDFYADPQLFLKIVHPEDCPVWEGVLRGEGPDLGISTLRWVHKDGRALWIEQHHVLVRDSQGHLLAVECVARDISSRKQLEEQLLQSQKMEAVGRLAGGVAHDFNNLLTVINGFSAQVLENLAPDAPMRQEIEEIGKAGQRAAALTRQLLAFSRRQVLSPRVLDLNGIVSDMNRMLRRVLGADIELITSLDPALESVQADPGQIEQVIINLAVNARDAMPEGGRLLLETANVQLDEAYAMQHRSVTPGRYVMLAVSDTGIGMDAQTQAHIFEPFFTTKPQGQGTGLGLSTVFGIVQQSGGDIWVYSEPDHGTTFKIYFPAVASPAAAVKASPDSKPHTGTETVLVVEDEDGVRKLIRSVLQRNGYTVLEARTGEEGLRFCQNFEGPIHLVITDLVMPQMGGRELAGHVATLRPDTRLLFISGYTNAGMIQHRELDPRTPFLQKPFTPAVLSSKVREALGTG